jgi:hypothetical protein
MNYEKCSHSTRVGRCEGKEEVGQNNSHLTEATRNRNLDNPVGSCRSIVSLKPKISPKDKIVKFEENASRADFAQCLAFPFRNPAAVVQIAHSGKGLLIAGSVS